MLLLVIVGLAGVAVFILWRLSPNLVAPPSDTIIAIWSPRPLWQEGSLTEPIQLWLLVLRPVGRTNLQIPIALTSSAIGSGMLPETQTTDLFAYWHSLQDDPVLLAQVVSQSLGVLVDEVLLVDTPIATAEELQVVALNQAAQYVAHSAWQSIWLDVAVALQKSEQIAPLSPASLPRIIDTRDVAVLGEFGMCSIAVINSTAVNGLAAAYGALFEQSGGSVIRLDGTTSITAGMLDDSFLQISETAQSNNLLIFRPGKEDSCSVVGSRVRKVSPELTVVEDQTQLTERLRADVVLILGESAAATGIWQLKQQ